MLNRLFLIFLFTVSFSGLLFASERDREIAQSLTKAQEQKGEAKTWEGRNTEQPYLALLNEYETIIHPDWTTEESYHTRVKIQKPAGKELGQWPIYYNKTREDIVDVKAFVETPDGKKIQSTGIQDEQAYEDLPMYADIKVKVISLPQVEVGSVIDVTVKSKSSRKEISNQFWDEVPYPVIATKFARHTYIFPEQMPIAFKSYKDQYKPLIEKKNGMVKYSLIFEETKDAEQEDLMPPLDEINGSFYLSSVKEWKVVADWYRDLVYKHTVDDTTISLKSLELANNKSSQKDKARAILEFIQDNFKYVAMNFGDHTSEPHSTTEIFKSHYGDSKDIALLVRQMFNLAGIEANMCLMNGEYTGNPENALPNPSVFEHAILEAVLDGQRYFIDPQTKGFDLGTYPSSYDNAYLLVIEPSGFRFDHLPVAKEEDRTMINQSDISIGPDGSATFDVHVTLPLEASQGFRAEWAATKEENREKFFEGLQANFPQGGVMVSHEVKGLEQRYGNVQFHLKYQAPAAYPVVNDMIILKEADQSDLPDFLAQNRQYPMFMPTNSLIQNTNVYHLPAGYAIDFLPPNYKLSVDFADINAEYVGADAMATVKTAYRFKRATVPANRYQEIKNFRADVYKKNDQYVVLRKKK